MPNHNVIHEENGFRILEVIDQCSSIEDLLGDAGTPECFGFIGHYTPGEEVFNHYIVDELKRQIPEA